MNYAKEYIRIAKKHIDQYGKEKVFTDRYLNTVTDRIIEVSGEVMPALKFKDWFLSELKQFKNDNQ